MIENVSTQLTVFHCFAHCLLPGRAFASLYALLFLEKEAEIGGRVSTTALFNTSKKMTLTSVIVNAVSQNEEKNQLSESGFDPVNSFRDLLQRRSVSIRLGWDRLDSFAL